MIAIVDAYHYATALNDFNVFASTFGLPTDPSANVTSSNNGVFQIVYATGRQPKANCDWGQEAALDISFDVDPNTGVSVYDSTSCQDMSGWMVFGGTSVSALCLSGKAGTFSAGTGWDFVTGIGTPRTLIGF